MKNSERIAIAAAVTAISLSAVPQVSTQQEIDTFPREEYRLKVAKALKDALPDPVQIRRGVQTTGDVLEQVRLSQNPDIVPIYDAGNEVQGEDDNVINLEKLAAVEAKIATGDFLPAYFLQKGWKIQSAIGRVTAAKTFHGRFIGAGVGSGFLIGPDLFVTNQHVVNNDAKASKLVVRFNWQYEYGGARPKMITESTISEIIFSHPQPLDYAILRLSPIRQWGGGDAVLDTDGGAILPGDEYGWVELPAPEDVVFIREQSVNLIQHPDGREKEVVLHNSFIVGVYENLVHYSSDTEYGSSGCPVFDNTWSLLALHRAPGEKEDGVIVSNQGVRIDRIVEDLWLKIGDLKQTNSESASAISQQLGFSSN